MKTTTYEDEDDDDDNDEDDEGDGEYGDEDYYLHPEHQKLPYNSLL
jgi:hypothetical protein